MIRTLDGNGREDFVRGCPCVIQVTYCTQITVYQPEHGLCCLILHLRLSAIRRSEIWNSILIPIVAIVIFKSGNLGSCIERDAISRSAEGSNELSCHLDFEKCSELPILCNRHSIESIDLLNSNMV